MRCKVDGHYSEPFSHFTGRVKHENRLMENSQDGSSFLKVFGKGV